MKQATSVFTILVLVAIILAPAAHSKTEQPHQRTFEVLSDPYAVGMPTHYTIIRGTSKVTFSHAMGGQFARAEVTSREETGTRFTRFLLSSNNKTYVPTLHLDTNFEVHHAANPSQCATPKELGTLATMDDMRVPITYGQIISKNREQLAKVSFFDKSCADSQFGKTHGDAVANASADVISLETQNTRPKSKFLKCLTDMGFAEESGEISGWIKQALVDPSVKPGIKVACSVDSKMRVAAQYSEKTRTITVKKTALPNRDDYADLIFHEMIHIAKVRDETPIDLMEECCSRGDQCELLRKYGEQRHNGEKRIALAESTDPKSVIAAEIVAVLKGTKETATAASSEVSVIAELEAVSMSASNPTQSCAASGLQMCRTIVDAGIDYLKNLYTSDRLSCGRKVGRNSHLLVGFLWENAFADDCGPTDGMGTIPDRLKSAQKDGQASWADTADNYSEKSPLSWETKAPANNSVPLNLASTSGTSPSFDNEPEPASNRKAGRTIASISPLPEPQSQARLGNSGNRRDVNSGRATVLVDTLEKAARVVTQTLTPEKIESLKVDYNAILAKNSKPVSSSTHFMVASFGGPVKVASIGDIKNVGFENPFLTARFQVNKDTGAMTLMDAKAIAAEKAATIKAAQSKTKEGSGASGAVAEGSKPGSATANVNAFGSSAPSNGDRMPTSKAKRDFESMTHKEITDFVTTSYSEVASELENHAFIKALAKNKIRIVDHENRKLGALTPKEIYVYRTDLSRLVSIGKSRAEK